MKPTLTTILLLLALAGVGQNNTQIDKEIDNWFKSVEKAEKEGRFNNVKKQTLGVGESMTLQFNIQPFDTIVVGTMTVTTYGDKYDTIPVIMMVCDTTSTQVWELRSPVVFWINGYNVQVTDDNYKMIDRTSPDGYRWKPAYSHYSYLDNKKKPLKPGIVVWMSKEK